MTGLIAHPQPHDQRVGSLIAAFEREFDRRPEGIAEAPGRVNLIGEHVDYNDGLVLPFAIDRGVLVAWVKREDDAIWAYSADFGEHSRFNLSNVAHGAVGDWANYVRAVADALSRAHRVGGLELVIAGDVPRGAGLSSSAAFEVAVAGAFRAAFDLTLDDVALATLCQRAENEYVGVQCGIMDQFASALSQRDHALLLDCRSLLYESVPLRLAAAGLSIVIANSAVGRELITSAYNDRRRECEEAALDLRTRLIRPELSSLRDVTAADLERVAVDSVPMQRARHVVSEIARVAAAADALSRDDFDAFGRLMVESHISLRDDYEVSSRELDLLVAFRWTTRCRLLS